MSIGPVPVALEYIGVISFAVSGASKAVSKEMDMLGVIFIAVITAMGGGFLRDLVIGVFPQKIFTEPAGACIAAAAGAVLFIAEYWLEKSGKQIIRSNKIVINIMDTIGLAAFTVLGVDAGINAGYSSNPFLLIFLGTVTGVGGGVLRDITLKEIPEIFMRNIYVCASAAGAAIFVFINARYGAPAAAVLISAMLTAAVRAAAIAFDLNLPVIKVKRNSTEQIEQSAVSSVGNSKINDRIGGKI